MAHRFPFRLLTVRGPLGDYVADSDLLRRYTQERDSAALELLIRRHAAAVWTACRRVLASETDAEDAFQATFLVLMRKAGAIRDSCIGGWLHRVAVNAALKQREHSARISTATDAQLADVPSRSPPEPDREHAAIIQEELARLPDRYRLPVVLCELEGLTHAEAARALGWPIGSVSGRLSRARHLLQDRLTRRGLAPTAVVLTALTVPATILGRATAAAVGTGPVLPAVSDLTKGVLSMMRLAQVKRLAFRLASAGLVVLMGVGAYTGLGRAPAGEENPNAVRTADPPANDKPAGEDKKANKKEDAVAMEQKALQGEWKVVGLQSGGKKAAPDEVKGMYWVIKDDLIEGKNPGEQLQRIGRFKIDPGKDPKQITITERTDNKVKTALGIYKLEHGRLTMCLRSGTELTEKDRPKEFSADVGDDREQGIIILESATAPPKPGGNPGPVGGTADEMKDRHWVVKDKDTLELVGPAGTAGTLVKVPRWVLKAGQEIVFSGGMESGSEEKGFRPLARGDWRICVLAENKDGSLTLVLRSYEVVQGTPRINSAKFDLFPDGRAVAAKGSEKSLTMRDLLARLPADAAEAAGGWVTPSARGEGGKNRYRLIAPTKTGACRFEEVTEPTGDLAGAVNSIKTLYTWDAERGLPETIRFEVFYSDKRIDRQVYRFKEVKPHDQTWRDEVSADADRFLPAQAAYLRSINSLSLSRTQAEIEVDRKHVQENLTALRQHLVRPEFREQLDVILSGYDHQTKSILETAERRRSVLGQPAADWSTTDLDGKKHALKDCRGKVVILDFWYSTCYYCLRGMPQMKELTTRFKDQPVIVLGMNTDAKEEDAKRVVDKMGLNYPSLKAGDISKNYKIDAFPTLIVIDQEGIVREVHLGDTETLEEDISKVVEGLLKAKK